MYFYCERSFLNYNTRKFDAILSFHSGVSIEDMQVLFNNYDKDLNQAVVIEFKGIPYGHNGYPKEGRWYNIPIGLFEIFNYVAFLTLTMRHPKWISKNFSQKV